MLKQVLTVLLSGLLVIGLGACDSADNGGDDVTDGSFTIEISGDVDATIEGFTYFGTEQDPNTPEDPFAIVFSSSEQVDYEGAWATIGREAGQPGTGSYAFANVDAEEDDFPADQFALFMYLPEEQAFVASTAGEMVITESDDDELSGSFEIQATGFRITGQQEEELTLTVEGSFDAVSPNELTVPSF